MNMDYVRDAFPIVNRRITMPFSGEERSVIYMDHAASTPPPRPVIDAVSRFVSEDYANVHRGNHVLSRVASDLFEDARRDLTDFVGGSLADQAMMFTTNTTGALNLAAHLMAKEDGIVLTTEMEHHSNDLPYRARGRTAHISVLDDGTLDLADYEAKLQSNKVKLVAVTGASNVSGLMPPVHAMARLAHDHGARILVDAAQRFAHAPLDVKPAGHPEHLDFVAAAGHKAYAPYGAAFLLAPQDVADRAPPYLPGGGTVLYVTSDDAMWNKAPARHEGGTPNIPGVIAFGAAARFLKGIGMHQVREHERVLTAKLLDGLREMPGVKVLGGGDAETRIGLAAFTIDGFDHAQVSTILDAEHAVATRNGCFCAHPYLYRLLGLDDESAAAMRARIDEAQTTRLDHIPGAARGSLGVFNTESDVDALLDGVRAIATGGVKGSYRYDPDEGWRVDAPARIPPVSEAARPA